MSKLKNIGLALAVGAATLASTSTFAIGFTAGDFKFNFDNYDSGTVGYPIGNPTCASAAACDLAAALPAPGAVGSEDTWGIFSIQSITSLTTNANIYVKGDGGKFLTGIFWGNVDELVFRGTLGPVDLTSAYANGGMLKMWENNVDYDAAKTPAGRIGTDGFDGISNLGGTLLLEAMFAGSADASVLGYSYLSTFNSNTFAGAGQGFLDVTGGAWASMVDTNTLFDAAGNRRDLFLDVTFNDVNGQAAANGWTVTSVGSVKGAAIPMPTSLALLGLGLVGLTTLRRRKAA